jgi:hypothetical protein
MIWFLERPGERLQCEIRRSAAGPGYELIWSSSDGRVHVEASDDPEELLRRRRALENWLRRDGWVRPGRVTPLHVVRPLPRGPAERRETT